MRDVHEEEETEYEASKFGLNYIKLDGNVGCMVNGAGLAMATMDVIGQSGSGPANFLDVGGGADESKVSRALTIIFSDQSVKAVLVNIFGGILRCDVVARGIIQAVNENPHIDLPIVVRMLGTNANEGREILSASGLNVILVDNLTDAATAMSDWV